MSSVKHWMAASPLPRLETRMLIEHALKVPRAWLIAHDTDALDAEQTARIGELVARRAAGEPMAYLLGRREFMSLDFAVTPAVLIPRPDTELLAQHAINLLRAMQQAGRPLEVLDVGTGSGALAVSIKHYCPFAVVTAADISEEALAVAGHNASRLGAAIRLLHSDVCGSLQPGEQFDLIVSNPPYIDARDEHLQRGDLRFEPRCALTDGRDGLHILQRLIAQAPQHLKSEGQLWVEHGWDQGPAVRTFLAQQGFKSVATLRDAGGRERVSGGIAHAL